MIVRRDHIAGAFFIAAGIVVWALSGDLPVGSLAFPGAGMMPKLVVAIMIALALATMLSAGSSPPVAELEWGDLGHASRVLAVAVPAVALYAWAGFLITMSLLLFSLLFVLVLSIRFFSISCAGPRRAQKRSTYSATCLSIGQATMTMIPLMRQYSVR